MATTTHPPTTDPMDASSDPQSPSNSHRDPPPHMSPNRSVLHRSAKKGLRNSVSKDFKEGKGEGLPGFWTTLDLAGQAQLAAVRRASSSPPCTPRRPKRRRHMQDACVGSDSPVGPLDEPRIIHFLESGKWGHHLWSLTLDLLEKLGLLTEATKRMANFSRWRELKHINDLATKDFTDGQTHFDILKCIVYILCEILPPKSTLQVDSLLFSQYIEEYEKWCKVWPSFYFLLVADLYFKRVSEDYGKNFKFPKQHFLIHALDDVRMKGVLRNGTTRTGEGTHQEVKQHYAQTNKRNTEAQISVRDEDQEVVARTRLLIDDFFKHASRAGEQSDATSGSENTKKEVDASQFKQGSARRIPNSRIPPGNGENQWIFGSPLQHGDSRSYEDLYGGNNPVYRSLDHRLRDFLHSQYPDEYLTYEDTILIEVFRCVYLEYQSKDDWTTAEDILRCNTNWYNSGPRYDCVLFNSDQPGIACARLRSLIRCKLPSSRVVDLAVVQNMKRSKWRPKTSWDGCVVLEEEANLTFLLMDYVIRGALLTPAEGPNSRNRFHYLVDAVGEPDIDDDLLSDDSGPRYDCVLFNSDQPGVACARLRSLVRCQLPSGRVVDLAVVQNMKPNKWRPKTSWDGCVVFEEEVDLTKSSLPFLLMDFVIRGALLAHAQGPSNSRRNFHYLVDVVDGDMFLRVLNAIGHAILACRRRAPTKQRKGAFEQEVARDAKMANRLILFNGVKAYAEERHKRALQRFLNCLRPARALCWGRGSGEG
ncbi:hypothetical protein R3P38DRAFT_3287864 [Favolaschia claudopus]|uniref:Uncharacterized protein n=1 Tax=Favolaschia claudopus TaxID=2862362 RepID=A0AAV9ZY29_9AGAR